MPNVPESTSPKHSRAVTSRLTKAELIQIIEDFAKKICKVRDYVYLCSAKRTEQSTQNILKPLFSGVPETVPIFGSVRLATKRGSASFVIYIN